LLIRNFLNFLTAKETPYSSLRMVEYLVSADLRLLEAVYISLRSITSSVFSS
jgi:hypothetical protein